MKKYLSGSMGMNMVFFIRLKTALAREWVSEASVGSNALGCTWEQASSESIGFLPLSFAHPPPPLVSSPLPPTDKKPLVRFSHTATVHSCCSPLVKYLLRESPYPRLSISNIKYMFSSSSSSFSTRDKKWTINFTAQRITPLGCRSLFVSWLLCCSRHTESPRLFAE